ncbi:hypothetical protein JCM9533A_74010 [Catenuloplanes niger JCM 9533]
MKIAVTTSAAGVSARRPSTRVTSLKPSYSVVTGSQRRSIRTVRMFSTSIVASGPSPASRSTRIAVHTSTAPNSRNTQVPVASAPAPSAMKTARRTSAPTMP